MFYPQIKINNLSLERPKKSRLLPNVLSQEEVLRIIQLTKNLKHRAIIVLLYSSGLRIGEVTGLLLKNIDILRKQIKVEGGKELQLIKLLEDKSSLFIKEPKEK